ncbi:DUF1501 domain-containing protein [Stratiformator vulcanicus]|uniref:Sulfatase n=1 Tax=Stratiformator vulcanicus TaxID=2527980 RepID=A0A517R562_9PLAN|nr:DUF1501 domain-containing protein [Stratiformator vulcanicus]QDT39028.1 hypothetical protein Pan189_34290 [Stratiformator vulcanicus]
MLCRHRQNLSTRREWLKTASCGFGGLALAGLLGQEQASGGASAHPLAEKQPHFTPKAKRIVFIFLQGGPSQVDLFDYKPELVKRHGEQPPFAADSRFKQVGMQNTKLLKPVTKLNRVGESGMWMSEQLPYLAKQADKLCMLKACETDTPAHPTAVQQIHTGSPTLVRPSAGAWINYGLGTENQNLPGFVTIHPTSEQGGPRNYGGAFLPAAYQGTPVFDGKIEHLESRGLPAGLQQRQLDYLLKMNRDHLGSAGGDDGLDAMIRSYELAFRMQAEAPEVLDISNESQATKKLYGVGEKGTDEMGQRMLLARRMVEAGVRFVQVTDAGWDHHGRIAKQLPQNCYGIDRPIAGFLQDLESRGLLEDTLVLCSGEFGRTPFDQDLSGGKAPPNNYGRGHHSLAYACFFAGGGVKGDMSYGVTDDFGYRGVAEKVHLHDIHATMLHQLGLDHERLTYRYAGRDFRLTDVYGRVIKEILA